MVVIAFKKHCTNRTMSLLISWYKNLRTDRKDGLFSILFHYFQMHFNQCEHIPSAMKNKTIALYLPNESRIYSSWWCSFFQCTNKNTHRRLSICLCLRQHSEPLFYFHSCTVVWKDGTRPQQCAHTKCWFNRSKAPPAVCAEAGEIPAPSTLCLCEYSIPGI